MSSVDLPVQRCYKAKDLEVFGVSDKEIIIDRILIPHLFKSHADASIRKPTRIGFYSLKVNKKTGKRVYFADKSQLRYLNVKNGHKYDLKVGYNPNIIWGQDSVGLDDFLRWILENRTKFTIGRQLHSIYNLNTDFICYRGVLTKLMVTPYEKREDWMLIAVKIGGTIYFHQLRTDAKEDSDQNQPEICNLLSYCGHSFEDMVCSEFNEVAGGGDSQLGSGDTGQFCCILRSRLKSHSLVYAAEMDCIEGKTHLTDPLDKLRFIEVKTTGTIHSARQRETFYRFKAIKWWTQSHLGAVDSILCGYRDSDQFVRNVERIPVKKLANERIHWSPHVCLNFLDSFLTCAKQCVIQEKVIYRIYCSPGLDITFTQTQLPIEAFIPRWYLNESPPQPLI
ncbi:decapping and exoribonuclease protein-like [Panonychus citri]|uniref:decapping and exoribonuclease protein-like n=1 Tax=Panonychus citri TaxID=50023 RepID=UPI002307CBF7|nr:decapping and exoribonuclease protein-like [Panonychus citri]